MADGGPFLLHIYYRVWSGSGVVGGGVWGIRASGARTKIFFCPPSRNWGNWVSILIGASHSPPTSRICLPPSTGAAFWTAVDAKEPRLRRA